MAIPTVSDPERPLLCQSLSFVSTAIPADAGRTTLSEDDYVQCSNDAVGEYRIDPDYGAPVEIWLCAEHAAEFDERIVESLGEP